MDSIFLKLLNTGIAAGWLILAVMFVRLVFRKIPRWVDCLLWGAVAVRLVCPFFGESPFSLLPSAELIKSHAIVDGELQNHIPSIDSRLPIVENTLNPILAKTFAYDVSDSAAPLQVAVFLAGRIWILGMVLLMLGAAVSMIRLRGMVREAVCLRERIYICDAVRSPFILGVVSPRVYLPSGMGEKDRDYILAHESAHLRRKDHWWKLAGYLLLCVYWFHPLCWAAYALFCRDIELACDEKAAKAMTLEERKEYSKVLLSCTGLRRLVMVCPLAFGEVGIRERVKAVLHYKKPTLWVTALAVVLCGVLAVCFLTNPTERHTVSITVPAGSTEVFCYSREEICPKGDTVTVYAGEGLGDTEVILLPTETREENAYDKPMYLTRGMPAVLKAERGAWFRIGVNVQNPTEKDREISVEVKNAKVRITDSLDDRMNGAEPDDPERKTESGDPERKKEWGDPERRKTLGGQEFELDYGTSALYSKEDMDEAIDLILEEFRGWEEQGCELHSIRYLSDDCNSEENISWMNELSKDGTVYTQCIQFTSDYHSPKKEAGAWNEDYEYEGWQWWLARPEGGFWTLLTWGY